MGLRIGSHPRSANSAVCCKENRGLRGAADQLPAICDQLSVTCYLPPATCHYHATFDFITTAAVASELCS